MAIGFFTGATCKYVRENLIPLAAAYCAELGSIPWYYCYNKTIIFYYSGNNEIMMGTT